jgi:hypothetical protein
LRDGISVVVEAEIMAEAIGLIYTVIAWGFASVEAGAILNVQSVG